MRPQNRVLYIVLPLIVLICLSTWQLRAKPDRETVVSQDGVWDLTGMDFTQKSAHILGDIEYVPGALLTPEAFAASADIVLGDVPDGTEYMTSRIRVLVPEGHYAFARPTADSASRIYVNGAWLADTGLPGETAEMTVQGEKLMVFTARPVNGVIEIVQQSSNFAHTESNSHVGWLIGDQQALDAWATRYKASDVVNMAFFLLLFIVHTLLYLMLPTYRANLWIALLCLVWTLRTGVTGAKILLTLTPALSWEAAFRAEYLSFPAAFVLLASAYHHIFPGAMHRWFRIAIYSLAGVLTVLYLFADTLFMSGTILYTEIVCALAALYILVRLAMKVRAPNVEQRVVFAGLAVVLAGIIHDAFYYNDMVLPFDFGALSESALVVFSLFQMVAMLHATIREAAAAKENERVALLTAEALRRDALLKEALHKAIPEGHLVVRGPLTLNTLASQAFLNEEDMLLTPKEFALLHLLMQYEGEAVSRERLFEEVWQQPAGGDHNALITGVSRLRKKIARSGYRIVAVRPHGYRFELAPEADGKKYVM